MTVQGAPRPLPLPPSPVTYPVIPYGVIRLDRKDLIVFAVFVIVVVVVVLEIATLRTVYYQLPPPKIKNQLCQLLICPILTNQQSRFAIKCTLE